METGLTPKEVLSEEFALKIISLEKYLRETKREFRMSDQLFRSGTSIGANIAESVFAESKQDFIHKLSISQKEGNESLYWLRLLFRSGYISEDSYNSLYQECTSIIKILGATITSIRNKLSASNS